MPDVKNIVGFPDRAAIVTRLTNSAFIVNFKEMDPRPQTVKIDTGRDRGGPALGVETFDLVSKSLVCEAVLLQSISFKVSSEGPLTLEDLKDTRFSLMIDGMMVVPDKAFTDHLEVGCNPLPDAGLDFSNPILPYLANQVDAGGAIPGSTFGYFIPNDSVIVVTVLKIPSGLGHLEIETRLVGATYAAPACSVQR